ncbi:hypothetical protein DV738_g4465, partial [Chaetothyriales sp. CBS 135597]
MHIATAAATTLASQLLNSTAAAGVVGGPSSTPPPRPDEEYNGECRLLGPFAILVQAALGVLALLSLVYKRWKERPQRPVKVWAFDASKQVFGSALLHVANLAMSLFSSGQTFPPFGPPPLPGDDGGATAETVHQPNPCSFYLLNLGIDTTLGIPILVVILKLLHAGASLTPLARPPESIKSGHYGNPPQASWWLKQAMIYFVGLLGMKICVFFIFQLCPWIVLVGDWALRWTEGNEAVQVAFVMLIFPLIMNAMQYYIIDTFIKNKEPDDDDDEHGALLSGRESEDHGGLVHNDAIVLDEAEVSKIRASHEPANNKHGGLAVHLKEHSGQGQDGGGRGTVTLTRRDGPMSGESSSPE